MNTLALIIYGVYLAAVGINGKAEQLWGDLKNDAGGFFTWIVAIAVLAALYDNPRTHRIVAPFAALLILALILHRFDDIKAQGQAIFDHYAKGAAFPDCPENAATSSGNKGNNVVPFTSNGSSKSTLKNNGNTPYAGISVQLPDVGPTWYTGPNTGNGG
jgi:hypothetical protein